jgi:hypothetical protein
MNIPWDQIFQIVVKLLENCDQPTVGTVRSPGPLARLRLERNVRTTMGLNHREWREDGQQIMATIYAKAAEAEDADLQELIDLAEAA